MLVQYIFVILLIFVGLFQICWASILQSGYHMNEEEMKIKIIIVGDSGSGKTNIKSRFFKGNFTQYSTPTVGIQLAKRKFWAPFHNKQAIFTLCCWDISGAENNTLLWNTYVKNAIGIIYVYDITKEESFHELEMWRERALQFVNSQVYTEMVIGNKCDLIHFREVRKEEAERWASRNQIELFFQTSALLNQRIDEAFFQMIRKMVKKFDDRLLKTIHLKKVDKRHRGCC